MASYVNKRPDRTQACQLPRRAVERVISPPPGRPPTSMCSVPSPSTRHSPLPCGSGRQAVRFRAESIDNDEDTGDRTVGARGVAQAGARAAAGDRHRAADGAGSGSGAAARPVGDGGRGAPAPPCGRAARETRSREPRATRRARARATDACRRGRRGRAARPRRSRSDRTAPGAARIARMRGEGPPAPESRRTGWRSAEPCGDRSAAFLPWV